MSDLPLPPIVDAASWRRDLDALRVREKAATRELDAIAAQRRRLPVVDLPTYTLQSADGPVTLAEMFDGHSQLITYHHMWFPHETWQCPGCTPAGTDSTHPTSRDSTALPEHPHFRDSPPSQPSVAAAPSWVPCAHENTE